MELGLVAIFCVLCFIYVIGFKNFKIQKWEIGTLFGKSIVADITDYVELFF